MRQFQCDYIAGCHPKVLEALVRTNLEEMPGYGDDPYCERAAQRIRCACEQPDAAVHFLSGGTQTNLTVISALLRPHQGVVAADTGHVEAHETGAIEATGHKVLTIANEDGKVSAAALEKLCQDYCQNEERVLFVQPGMLYISFPTETGTIYSLSELSELKAVCQKYHLPLFIDGARLTYGLAASPDVTLPDIARLADVFYIGGTKCGTLACEALVINSPELKRDFPALMRVRGALLAKARLGGVQFDALFTDRLYETIGREAVTQAMALRAAFLEAGLTMDGSSPTNQQFVIFNPAQFEFMQKRYRFELCRRLADGRSVVRFCTAWSTTAQAMTELIADVRQLAGL